MTRRFPKCLRVMPEYGSSGIWVVKAIGPFRHGMIEHRSLNLPEELAGDFREWIERYWKVLDAPAEFDTAGFNETGRKLARALKRHVGPDTEVLFAPIRIDNSLDAEESIGLDQD